MIGGSGGGMEGVIGGGGGEIEGAPAITSMWSIRRSNCCSKYGELGNRTSSGATIKPSPLSIASEVVIQLVG